MVPKVGPAGMPSFQEWLKEKDSGGPRNIREAVSIRKESNIVKYSQGDT